MFSKTPGRGRGRTLRRFPSGQGEGGGRRRGAGSGGLWGARRATFCAAFSRGRGRFLPPSCSTTPLQVQAQLRWSGCLEGAIPAEGLILPPLGSAGELGQGSVGIRCRRGGAGRCYDGGRGSPRATPSTPCPGFWVQCRYPRSCGMVPGWLWGWVLPPVGWDHAAVPLPSPCVPVLSPAGCWWQRCSLRALSISRTNPTLSPLQKAPRWWRGGHLPQGALQP